MEPSVSKTSATLAVLACLTLCACASPNTKNAAEPVTPTEHFAIDVAKQPETLRLAVHREGLSANQAQALGVFAQRWVDGGGEEITMQSPEHGANPADAYRTAADARDRLISDGVAPARIQIIGYEADGDAHAPIIVGFQRYVAKGPQCGHAWENLTATGSNSAYGSFGCAVTANIAAQIADPRDLLYPRAIEPSDAARRQTVLDHYRKGETTSSAKDDQANGAVSTAVH
jgi:pilus assembly protein CpaD